MVVFGYVFLTVSFWDLLYLLTAVEMENKKILFFPLKLLHKGLLVMCHCSNLSVSSPGGHVTVLLWTKLALGPLSHCSLSLLTLDS